MVTMFNEYQNIKSMQYWYTTPELEEQFKTKKLLGMKRIKLRAVPTYQATTILDLKAEGVVRRSSEYDAEKRVTYYTFELE